MPSRPCGGFAPGDVDERRRDIDERDQGIARCGGLGDAGPDGDKGHVQAGVVERPFRVRPFGALVGRVNEEGVVLEAVLLEHRPDFADALIHRRDVLVVIGEGPAGQVGVNEEAGQLQPGGIEVLIRLPHHVRAAVGHDQAQRRVPSGPGVLRQKSVNGFRVQTFHAVGPGNRRILRQPGREVFEAEDLLGDGVGLVRQHDAVTQLPQVRGQRRDVRPAGRVIAHAAVAGRIQARVQGGARRRARRRRREHAGEPRPFLGQGVDVRRPDVRVPVAAHEVDAVIVRDVQDDVGTLGRSGLAEERTAAREYRRPQGGTLQETSATDVGTHGATPRQCVFRIVAQIVRCVAAKGKTGLISCGAAVFCKLGAGAASNMSAMAKVTEELALVERFRRGDDSAFEEIVEQHAAEVAALANRLLGWPGDVDDVVQEVFVAAFLGLKKFRGESSLRTWPTFSRPW